jgi:hypothetical protein
MPGTPRKDCKPRSASFSGSGVHEDKESEVTFPNLVKITGGTAP